MSSVLWVRRYWIDVSFTPAAILVGKIALPIFLFRFLFMRRVLEIFPLAIFVMAAVQYVKFKNGADVHIYWPLSFAPYWALSLGLLGHVALRTTARPLARRESADPKGLVPLITLGYVGVLALLILPDGINGLHYARATGVRFNEKGARIFEDRDKSQALEWMAASMVPGTVVQIHEGFKESWGEEWALHRPIRANAGLPNYGGPHEERYFIGDLRFLSGSDQKRLADAFHMVVVGSYFLIDREAPKGPVESYVFDEREPTFLEWYLTSPTEPVRTLRPDAWSTWELREHWGQTPNPPPTATPETREQLRIAHNIAVEANDSALAERLENELVAQLDANAAAVFSDGTRLLGKHLTASVAPALGVYFLATGPAEGELEFAIASSIEARRLLSLIPPDDKVKQLGAPFVISPKLWHKDFIYAERCDVRQRPGTERFVGHFDGHGKNAPKPMIGEDVPIMTLR